ncbi:MAG: DNA repair protein RecN [bacterium]|nr:DNA repair protein RecN [bacterium]
MLGHLSIRDFALIQNVNLTFRSGLTVLLGETGAGKSILIDALAAAMGERMSADVIRTGAKKCVIEATFDVAQIDAVGVFLATHELDINEQLVCRRELTASGTSRCFINDTPVQTTVARALAQVLLDFHGQHDTHGLLHATRHREVIDQAAGHDDLLEAMQHAWRDVIEKRDRLAATKLRARTADEDRARMQFLIDEIAHINPQPEEDDSIRAELLRAESSELVMSAAIVVRDLLYAGDVAAYDLLQQVRERLVSLTAFDPSLLRYVEDIDSALIACKETAGAVSAYTEPEDFSSEHLEYLRQRQIGLQRIARKYGTLADAITHHERLEREVQMLEHLDEELAGHEKALVFATAEATSIAKKLSSSRRKAAATLEKGVVKGLQSMGMPSAELQTEIEKVELTASGADAVAFSFTSNLGEPLRPLAKVASGGELSRVMLSLKQVMARRGGIGTLVFDEIDTGISGRIARHVGEVMKDLSKNHQILCITHLPQIASLASAFIRVSKSELHGVTTVTAENITSEDAVIEIARLLAGTSVTPAALDSARELMQPL